MKFIKNFGLSLSTIERVVYSSVDIKEKRNVIKNKTKQKVIKLLRDGKSQGKVADIVGRSQATISLWANNLKEI